MHSLRFDGESDEAFRERAERMARYAKLLANAALDNHCIQQFIEPALPYTEEGQRQNPTVRVEYDEAFAIGGIGECLQATRSKSWGDGPFIHPLRPDDPVDPMYILYVLKPNSLYNRRFQQRQRMKELLGKRYRKLVETAKRDTLAVFLDNLQSEQAYAIRRILRMEPTTFWRACKGRLTDLPDTPGRLDSAVLASLPANGKQLFLTFDRPPTPDDHTS